MLTKKRYYNGIYIQLGIISLSSHFLHFSLRLDSTSLTSFGFFGGVILKYSRSTEYCIFFSHILDRVHREYKKREYHFFILWKYLRIFSFCVLFVEPATSLFVFLFFDLSQFMFRASNSLAIFWYQLESKKLLLSYLHTFLNTISNKLYNIYHFSISFKYYFFIPF